MKTRFTMFCALLALTCMVALGANIDGKWTRENQGKDGKATTQTLTLKADGSKLTGNLDGGRGPTDITEGMIMGNDIMFKVSRPGRGGGDPTVVSYKGTLSGDDLKITVDQGRGPQEQAFKRAK